MLENDRLRLNNCVVAYSDPVESEDEHFYICPHCKQAVDMRKLGDVFYHEDRPHEPMPVS